MNFSLCPYQSPQLDLLMWMSRTALELIGQSGLGHSFDPLTDATLHPFASMIKEFG